MCDCSFNPLNPPTSDDPTTTDTILVTTTSPPLRKPPYSIITVGPASVGKTQLINRICKGHFQEHTVPTIGVDFWSTEIPVYGRKDPLKVSFWDTAGQERYRAITKAYYRNANVVLLAFSFSLNLMIDNEWFLEISEMVPEDSLYFLVCTQIDRDNQGLTAAGMKNIPQKCNIPEFIRKKLGHVVFNVSAKEGWGIDVLKTEIARQCAETFESHHVSFNSYSVV